MSQDVLPDGSGWLAGMTEPILSGRVDIVQAEEQVPRELQAQMQLFHFTSCYSHWKTPYIRLSCSGMAISRSAWQQTGFGDVPMSEDKELGRKARDMKMRVGLYFEVTLIHGHAFSISGLAKRSFNEGMGARYTDGRYSLVQLFRDLLNYRFYKQIISLALKHRRIPLFKALGFTIRPMFLYLGYRFGEGYWS